MNLTWRIRTGQPEDLPAIERLVASVGGDLEDLAPEQFVVALDQEQQLIGGGRIKPYPGFCELASLAVHGDWRASGIGREIVGQLLRAHTGPIYLICEDNVVSFFRRFGFDLIPLSETLPGLQSKLERYVAEVGHINMMRRD